jgi:hydrogenase-4 component F
LLALAIVFVGMATIVLRMAYGPPPASMATSASGSLVNCRADSVARRESLWSIAPATALGLAVLTLGVYVPPQLTELLRQAAVALGGK